MPSQTGSTIIDEVVEKDLYNQWYDEYTEYAKSLGIIE